MGFLKRSSVKKDFDDHEWRNIGEVKSIIVGDKPNTVDERIEIFKDAMDIATQVIEKHPLEPYEIMSGSAGPLTAAPKFTKTAAEQFMDMTVVIADWILDRRY